MSPPGEEQALEPLRLGDEGAKTGSPELRSVPSRSLAWAGVVKPFTWFLFALLAAAMATPFFLIGALQAPDELDRVSKTIEWAHTILPPLVGFVGAVVGYYFGTRSDKGDQAGDSGT